MDGGSLLRTIEKGEETGTGKVLKASQRERLALLLQSPGRPHERIRRCIREDRDAPRTHLDEAWQEARVEV